MDVGAVAERGLADVSAVDKGIVRLDTRVSGVGPNAPLPLAKSQYDVPTRLAEMDEGGVQVHAVSLPPFLFCTNADDESFTTGIVREGNDELAQYVAQAPDRLLGLGYVPLGWPGVADEARRVLDDLGLAGIAIGSQGGGKDLDDPVNDELWALLSERGTFTFMHPSGMPAGPRLKDFWMPQLVGYPMETAIAVARLTFGRVLERFPFHLCLAHGGGCVPSLRGRMDMGWNRKDVAHTTAVPPSEFTDQLYYDTAVFNSTMLARIVRTSAPITSCWAPTTRSSWATSPRGRRWPTWVWTTPTAGRSSGTTRPSCSACRSPPNDQPPGTEHRLRAPLLCADQRHRRRTAPLVSEPTSRARTWRSTIVDDPRAAKMIRCGVGERVSGGWRRRASAAAGGPPAA